MEDIQIFKKIVNIENFILLRLKAIEENKDRIKFLGGRFVETLKAYYKETNNIDLDDEKNFDELITKKLSDFEFFEIVRHYYFQALLKLDTKLKRKIESISKAYNLSEEQRNFIYFFYLLLNDAKWELSYFFSEKKKYKNDLHIYVAEILKVESSKVKEYLFDENSIFFQYRIFSKGDTLKFEGCFEYFLDYHEGEDFFEYLFQKSDMDDLLSLSDFSEESSNHYLSILQRNCNYLVEMNFNSCFFEHSFVSSLAKELKKTCYVIRISRKCSSIQYDKITMSLLYLTKFEVKDALFFVQVEGDTVSSEGWRNLLCFFSNHLNVSKNNIFFGNRFISLTTESNIFLFAPSNSKLFLNTTTLEVRKKIYQKVLTESFSSDEFFLNYEVSYAFLERIISLNLSKKELLFHICEELGVDVTKKTFLSNEKVSFDFINAEISPEKMKKIISNFKVQSNFYQMTRLSFLFHGAPGTGKSLTAEKLCLDLGINYKKVALSDVGSIYVHETETRLREIFQEASGSTALIFDEVDTFLNSRETGSQRYHVSEVNEFLNCLDNFQGLFFATTNFPDLLDSAALRRFDFKVKFNFLTSHQSKQMIEKYFNLDNELEKNYILQILQNSKKITPDVISNAFKQSILMQGTGHENILSIFDQIDKDKKHPIKLLQSHQLI